MATYREEWLDLAVPEVSALLKDRADVVVPQVRVSTGWPSKGGTSTKKRTIGECWKAEVSGDGVPQIFISPVLDDPIQILGVLVHELIHAIHPTAKHQGDFIKTAKAVGLTPKWTATGVDAELLAPALKEIADELGEYPHSKLTPSIQRPVQTTRMLKLEAMDCGYIVRTTQKWIDEGMPLCPHGEEMSLA
jgi:hypothetical protein